MRGPLPSRGNNRASYNLTQWAVEQRFITSTGSSQALTRFLLQKAFKPLARLLRTLKVTPRCGENPKNCTGRQIRIGGQWAQRPPSGLGGWAIDWKRAIRTESRPLNETRGISPSSRIRCTVSSVNNASAQGFDSDWPAIP